MTDFKEGYFKTTPNFLVSSITILLLWSSSTKTSTFDKSISAFAYVFLSSGHNTFNLATSPTDFALICKKTYSKSNNGLSSGSISPNVQDLTMSFTALNISSGLPDSNAINNIFSSFTKKGLYVIFFCCDGKVNSYLATFA